MFLIGTVFLIIYTHIIIGEMDGSFFIALTYIPFFSTIAVLARLNVGYVGWWEIALSFMILLITTILIGCVASHIYKFGVVSTGKSFADNVRSIKFNRS